MNKSTLEKLHYEKLKNIVKGYCVSGLGKELIERIEPSCDIKNVNRRLDETSEGRMLLDMSYHIPLEGIHNINPLIDKIEKGAVLDPSELTLITDFIRGCGKVKRFFENKEGYAPNLSAYAQCIYQLSHIEEEINQSITGNRVSSSASKELNRIRRLMDNCQGKIKEKLEGFLRSSTNKTYIQEFYISERNGKYTIPMKASYKNQVQGTVVEVSSKGSTVFMEPASISKYSTELEMLRGDEYNEEFRILSSITELIYESIREMKINIDAIAEYDMIWAKAKYSYDINGIKPKINNNGYIKIVKGRYALLKNGVPLDFEIGENYRSLIITGPNAGGKTVVMKTVGIMVLAVQCGFHIEAMAGTEISLFEKIFADIGDDQSIENSLSTFSSHVKNLAEIIKECNKSTLLLFDEIGSGTEPNEGAALAIAILEDVYKKGCITVATTHYGEIKNFSENHTDFENAAMEFRSDTLEPLYKLTIGKSGHSNALYISKKMGIPQCIIDKTKKYIETKEYNYDTINHSKVRKESLDLAKGEKLYFDYEVGDKVLLLHNNESAIVYEGIDNFNNVKVFYNKEVMEINYKRLKLMIKASELYPEDYDMNQIFTEFTQRKLEKDIARGSKKALKALQKEMK